MKKLISVMLLFIFLCSCSGDKTVAPKLCGTSFSAEMTYYNESYAFDGKLGEDGTLYAEITSPEELSGLKMTLNGEETLVEYKGIVYTPVEGTMPFSKIIDDFYSSLNEIISLGEEAVSDSEGKIKRGSGAEEFTLTVSPTGLPQKIEMPDERFFVTFYNTKIEQEK